MSALTVYTHLTDLQKGAFINPVGVQARPSESIL